LVSVVGRLSARAALPARLAFRHASRHRLRNGAAVAAVCAAISGSVGMSLFLAADTSTAQVTNAPTGQVLLPPEASGFSDGA
jgi:putative ABC transport system permease protein